MLQRLASRWIEPNPEYWVDRFWMAIADCLPRPLVSWTVARMVAHATTGKWGNTNPSTITALDAMKRWEEVENGTD